MQNRNRTTEEPSKKKKPNGRGKIRDLHQEEMNNRIMFEIQSMATEALRMLTNDESDAKVPD